jgi:Flp pilus assembly protein TadG
VFALRATRGAVMVEYLIAFLPVFFLFATAFQVADLYAGHLIVQRAASAAGRAASVVLPDDPDFYGGTAVGSFSGARRADIERAAAWVLTAAPRFWNEAQNDLNGLEVTADGRESVVVRVTAEYRCYPLGILVCGPDGVQTVSAAARYPYQGARYCYDGQAPPCG